MDQDEGLDMFGTGDFRDVARTIGVDNALKLSDEFGGMVLTIPKLNAMRRETRDKTIREAYDKGTSVRQLAREHRISMRQIHNILGAKP